MENKLNEVGRTAVRIGTFFSIFKAANQFSIGEELESVHIERQRAQAAHNLIDFYNQFSRGDTSRLDALNKEGKEGRQQVAVILRRLTIVAKEVDLPIAEKVGPGPAASMPKQKSVKDQRKYRQVLREV